MIIGGGSIQEMINSLKRNRALLPSSRRVKFDRRDGFDNTNVYDKFPRHDVPPEKIKEVRKKILERAEAEKRRNRVFNILFFIIVILGFCLVAMLVN